MVILDEHTHMGVDQKALARNYVFGNHSSGLKNPPRKIGEGVCKINCLFFLAEDSALVSWRYACALTCLQTRHPC